MTFRDDSALRVTDGFLFKAAKPLFQEEVLFPEGGEPFPFRGGAAHFRDKLRDRDMLLPHPFDSIDLGGLKGLLPVDVKPFSFGCGATHFRDKLRDHDMLLPHPFESSNAMGLRGAEPAEPVAEPDGGP